MNMAGSVLVDTNIVIAHFRGDKVLHPHFTGITPVYLPWVVLGELHFVKAELAQRGRPIPGNDLWIAAMARQHDLPLATRDAHFAQVQRLKTLAWYL